MLDIYDYERFKVYSSKDANAPALSKANGSFGVVLKACLITGYGTKTPPGGWTMPLEDANNGVRTLKSTAVLSTRCEYKVFGDTTSQFTMSATREGDSTAFATITRSKQMYNVTGNQDWIILANSVSCYVILQTVNATAWSVPMFFGNAYTTATAKLIGGIWGTQSPDYSEDNYGIYKMQMQSELANGYIFEQFFKAKSEYVTDGTNIFYPVIFIKQNAGDRIFLPGLVVNAGVVATPDDVIRYTKITESTGDVLFFKIGWAESISQFGIATRATIT